MAPLRQGQAPTENGVGMGAGVDGSVEVRGTPVTAMTEVALRQTQLSPSGLAAGLGVGPAPVAPEAVVLVQMPRRPPQPVQIAPGAGFGVMAATAEVGQAPVRTAA